MAPRSNILKFITILALLSLLILVFMNIFNDGQSYHYIYKESRVWQEEIKLLSPDMVAIETRTNKSIIEHLPPQLLVTPKVYVPTDDELVAIIEQKLPNLPFGYLNRNKFKGLKKSSNCAVYPALETLNYYNTYWQTYRIHNITFHLYGAYYDNRIAVKNRPVVRILAMINYHKLKFPLSFCQLWFEDTNRPVIVEISEYNLIWNRKWKIPSDFYVPYLITCKVPAKDVNFTGDPIPKVVNVVQNECDTASNSLRIIYEKPQAPADVQDFAVCVKGLDFLYEDISLRLIEWLEILKILGVYKVYFYRLTLHRNVNRVLNYYESQGFIEVKNTSMVGGVVDMPELDHWLIQRYKLNKRFNELIPYNDCFYSNMYKYKHIAIMDIDEVIMPKGDFIHWSQLVTYAKAFEKKYNCLQGFPSLCAPHFYFPATNYSFAPTSTFMLEHPYRTAKAMRRGHNTKCLHNTQLVSSLHNHYSLSWLNKCKLFDFGSDVCQLQHYREEVKSEYAADLIRDDSMERFRQPLLKRYSRVLEDLNWLR